MNTMIGADQAVGTLRATARTASETLRPRRSSVLALAGALTLAAAMAGCSSVTASASDEHAKPASAAGGRSAAAPVSGRVHLTDYSINSDGASSRVILTGAVGDWGTAVSVTASGAVDSDHTQDLQLRLGHGGLRISIAALDKAIVKAYQHWPHNTVTCSGSISVSANAGIVPGSGSGAYRGVSGSFTLTAVIDEVDRSPVCDGTSAFLAQFILVSGYGTVAAG